MNIQRSNFIEPSVDSEPSPPSLLTFIIFITIISSFAAIGWFLRINILQLTGLTNRLFRCLRITLTYFVIPFLFLKYYKLPLRDYGVRIGDFKKFFLGIIVYLIPTYVFIEYQIFFGNWSSSNYGEIDLIINLLLIAWMASLTDFFTRGFILLYVKRFNNTLKAIITQEVFWFLLHLYEIIYLEPYIGLLGAILLTVIIGFLGDLVVLYDESIIGLAVGHSTFNFLFITKAIGLW